MRRVGLAVVALGAVFVTVNTVFGSGTTKVCVPTKEGKPITTPKGGACKGGALTEIATGAAGTVVAHARNTSALTTQSHGSYQPVPFGESNAWTQNAHELNKFVVELTVDSHECVVTMSSLEPLRVQFFIDTEQVYLELGRLERSSRITFRFDEVNQQPGFEAPPFFLGDSETAKKHILTFKAADECESGHVTIQSVVVDVLGFR